VADVFYFQQGGGFMADKVMQARDAYAGFP
jgi:hypothetical protein